jgi:hypothetical protein
MKDSDVSILGVEMKQSLWWQLIYTVTIMLSTQSSLFRRLHQSQVQKHKATLLESSQQHHEGRRGSQSAGEGWTFRKIEPMQRL